jgi:hypothetical protein
MKTSHYKTTQQFIDRYCIGIDTSVISPDIDNLIKEYTISQISNKQKIIQNFLKYKIVGWVEKIKLSKQNKIGSLSYFQTLYGSVIGQVLFDESNRKRKTRKKETHFKSVEHLLSQKCMMVLGGKFSKNIINNLDILIKLHDKKFLINNKYCMLKTLIENDVSEVSWDILFERSKHLKNDACSLDGLILKYGEVCGKRLFAERGILVAVTKESYTKTHTEEEWNKLCEKKKSNLGESGYIKKYGDDEGKKKWEEYLTKWNAGIQKRKNSGIWKNGLTLTEMQEKYGIENGYNRWKNRIDARKYTLSLNRFIERFGKEDGIIQYYCYVDKMVSNCRKLGGFSKISQKLFDEIYNKLDKNKQMMCKYYTKSGEEKFYITEVNGLAMMFVDFKCGNAIIEFDGDYWHSTQATQSRDKIKQKILEDRGYRVFRVKEREYNTNKESITQDCINFINKYYERT